MQIKKFTVCVTGERHLWQEFATFEEALDYCLGLPNKGKAIYHADVFEKDTDQNGNTVNVFKALPLPTRK